MPKNHINRLTLEFGSATAEIAFVCAIREYIEEREQTAKETDRDMDERNSARWSAKELKKVQRQIKKQWNWA